MKKVKQIKKSLKVQENIPDTYHVNGIVYVREDLMNSKVNSIMERIAVGVETQAEFYKKYDKEMNFLMMTLRKKLRTVNLRSLF